MWTALGPNIDEANAERVAGTLEVLKGIYNSIEKDCCSAQYRCHRTTTQAYEAVAQITKDLLSQNVF